MSSPLSSLTILWEDYSAPSPIVKFRSQENKQQVPPLRYAPVGMGLGCLRAADLFTPSLVGAPCFSRGSWTSVQRKSGPSSGMGFSPGFSRPAVKRMIKVEFSSATLKRCFPLLKQRAPTHLARLFRLSGPKQARDPRFSQPAPDPNQSAAPIFVIPSAAEGSAFFSVLTEPLLPPPSDRPLVLFLLQRPKPPR
jgi:hypothetical protein